MARELYSTISKMRGQRYVLLEELLPDFEHLWLRDEHGESYFSEIVVPLLRADACDTISQPQAKDPSFVAPQRIIAPSERTYFPGEAWTYLKLYAAPSQHEELLTGPVREVIGSLEEQGLIDRWFFLRYADPEPHLRLRFHAKNVDHIPAVLTLVCQWSTQIARSGHIQRYVLDTYEREVERYGGPEAIDLLEQVFMADSAMVINLLAARYAHHLTLDPLAIAVFTLDHFFTAWGWRRQQCLEWTHQVSEKYAWSKAFRPKRKHYCALLSPSKQLDSSLAEQYALLRELVRSQETYLGKVGSQVRQLEKLGKLWGSETSLLSSLAHMHLNRLLERGESEAQVYAFWRHTLDSLERKPEEDTLRWVSYNEG